MIFSPTFRVYKSFSLAVMRHIFVLFLVSHGSHLGTFPWMQCLPNLIPILESVKLALSKENMACSALDVVLGSFMTSWMSHRCTAAVILVEAFKYIAPVPFTAAGRANSFFRDLNV
ncbi:hypothetical protein XENOCAPTIV_009616 [Xenoophorus captivus]|uniref:Uncharacterized protein n=1 Tax=Xenoophorus captivus TaxID=1517983 RepID=A0ABV0RKG0_9TELE